MLGLEELEERYKDVVTFLQDAEMGQIDGEQFHLGVIYHQSVLRELQGSWQRIVEFVIKQENDNT